MSDLDKDIEILKKVQGIFEHLKTHGWINDIKRDVDTDTVILSIENVLKELSTYKKIAEKLAIEVENLDDMLSAEIGSHTKGYCNIENGCIFNYERKCSECVLDWARKEVENGTRK